MASTSYGAPIAGQIVTASETRIVPPGAIIWYAVTATNTAINGFLVCNGQPYSKATYPRLCDALDYKYGGSGDTFYVPDLITDNDGGTSGVFIRAAQGNLVSTKQSDAIRNISGTAYGNGLYSSSGDFVMVDGAFSDRYKSFTDMRWIYGDTDVSTDTRFSLQFSANAGQIANNPMAGHASDTGDIHPYDIYLLPLIAY